MIAAGSFVVTWLSLGCVQAQDKTTQLPSPLDLHSAIKQLHYGTHPDLLHARARQLITQAQADRMNARYALQAAVNLRAQWVDPSERAFDTSRNDHKASLNISKHLYDFGVTGELEDVSDSLVRASEIDRAYAMKLHTIDITRKYLDVLLADLEFSWSNEAMSMDFVSLDKVRDMYAVNQLDEIDLLEKESRYQQSLAVRRTSEAKQRVTRVQLAEALNTPGQLAAELETPTFHRLMAPVEEPDKLMQLALSQYPEIQAQMQRVAAASAQYSADSSQWMPSLSAEIELAEYGRDLPSRENWRAALNLKIPIHENGMNRAAAAEAHASLLQQRAELQRLQSQIREDVFMLWQNINMLIAKSQALAVAQRHAYRALDRSRGEYELELRTDFGDAQVRISKVRFDKATNDYALVIEKMRLALMIGEDPADILFVKGDKQ